jgi:hypothetical protein
MGKAESSRPLSVEFPFSPTTILLADRQVCACIGSVTGWLDVWLHAMMAAHLSLVSSWSQYSMVWATLAREFFRIARVSERGPSVSCLPISLYAHVRVRKGGDDGVNRKAVLTTHLRLIIALAAAS